MVMVLYKHINIFLSFFMMNIISSAIALVLKNIFFPKTSGCIREQFEHNTDFAWLHVVSSVGITKWMQKTAHSWIKTPRNTQNNNASKSMPWKKEQHSPTSGFTIACPIAQHLPSITWQQLWSYNSSGSHLGLSLSPLLFPPFFPTSYVLFHSVLSLALFPSLIFYLLSIPFLLHTEGTALCTHPQANFDYFPGEMSYLCVVFVSSYVLCLQLCYIFYYAAILLLLLMTHWWQFWALCI